MEEERKKRSSGTEQVGARSLLSGIRAVVMDIEGTTTPISYVNETVFPFIRDHVRSYLEETYDLAQTQDDIQALSKFAVSSDAGENYMVIPEGDDVERSDVITSLLSLITRLMDKDSKVTPLKQLQGHVWQHALNAGHKLSGLDVYDDVVDACKKMKQSGLDLYIYSSGSKEAQKLLFGHSSHGDLLYLFSGHFDTTVGVKRERQSYVTISGEIKKSADEILFLTDIPAEASAAREAGMRCCLVVREGNAALTNEELNSYPVVHTFSELFTSPGSAESTSEAEPVVKQQKVETETSRSCIGNAEK